MLPIAGENQISSPRKKTIGVGRTRFRLVVHYSCFLCFFEVHYISFDVHLFKPILADHPRDEICVPPEDMICHDLLLFFDDPR